MPKPDTRIADQPAVTMEQLFQIGLSHIAYVKAVEGGYTIHTADGKEIARFAERDVAFAACRQHDLEPLSVH